MTPVASSDPGGFASGCWIAHGSTAMIPRRLYEQTGNYDVRLRHPCDFEWFLRFGCHGGRLLVSPEARVHILPSTVNVQSLVKVREANIIILQEMYSGEIPHSGHKGLIRRLRSFRALLEASVHLGNRWYGHFLVCILCSWFLVPRSRIHLKRWWQ